MTHLQNDVNQRLSSRVGHMLLFFWHTSSASHTISTVFDTKLLIWRASYYVCVLPSELLYNFRAHIYWTVPKIYLNNKSFTTYWCDCGTAFNLRQVIKYLISGFHLENCSIASFNFGKSDETSISNQKKLNISIKISCFGFVKSSCTQKLTCWN